MVHVHLLALWCLLCHTLVVLNVLEVYSFYVITEVCLRDIFVPAQFERQDGNTFTLLLQAKLAYIVGIINLFEIIYKEANCSLNPENHVICFPQYPRSNYVGLEYLKKSSAVCLGFNVQEGVEVVVSSTNKESIFQEVFQCAFLTSFQRGMTNILFAVVVLGRKLPHHSRVQQHAA